MPTTEEIIMRNGRFVRRDVQTTEIDLGDQVEVIQKLLPRPTASIFNAFQITWRSIQVNAHIITGSVKTAAVVEIPVIGPRCVFSPVFSNEGKNKIAAYKSMAVSEKADLMKNLERYVNRWTPLFNKQQPTDPFEILTQANIPWNVELHGVLMFIVVFNKNSGQITKSEFTGLQQHTYEHCYMATLKNKELRALNLVNHFDDGRLCMGREFENKYSTSSIGIMQMTQAACDSYNTAQSNADLYRTGMEENWALNSNRTNLYYASSNSIIKPNTLSLSFMNGLL